MAEPKPKVDMTKLLAFCKDFVAKKPAMNRFRKQCEKQVLNEFDNAVKQAIKTVEEESKKLPKDDKLIKKQYKTLVAYMMDDKVFGRNNFYTTDVMPEIAKNKGKKPQKKSEARPSASGSAAKRKFEFSPNEDDKNSE